MDTLTIITAMSGVPERKTESCFVYVKILSIGYVLSLTMFLFFLTYCKRWETCFHQKQTNYKSLLVSYNES